MKNVCMKNITQSSDQRLMKTNEILSNQLSGRASSLPRVVARSVAPLPGINSLFCITELPEIMFHSEALLPQIAGCSRPKYPVGEFGLPCLLGDKLAHSQRPLVLVKDLRVDTEFSQLLACPRLGKCETKANNISSFLKTRNVKT